MMDAARMFEPPPARPRAGLLYLILGFARDAIEEPKVHYV